MQAIINGRNPNLNDTCTDCGSHADIGALLEEGDTLLELEFVGAQAVADAQIIADRATARFAEAKVEITETETGAKLKLEFSVTAEKMIFQMSL